MWPTSIRPKSRNTKERIQQHLIVYTQGGCSVSYRTTEANNGSIDKRTHHHPFAGMPIPYNESVLLFVPISPRIPVLGVIVCSEVLEQDREVRSGDRHGK